MKSLLLPLLALLALPILVNAHTEIPGEIGLQWGFKKDEKDFKEYKELTESELEALSYLCKLGLNADDGIWSNQDINAAISAIRFGQHWPNGASYNAYQTCNRGGFLD